MSETATIDTFVTDTAPDPHAQPGYPLPEERNTDESPRTDVDADGIAYDPQRHCKDQNGQPKRRKDGRWAGKPGRSGGGSANGGIATSITAIPPVVDENAARISAKQYVGMIVMTAVMVLGKELIPTKDEQTNMENAWTEYIMVSGIPTLPPWAMVLISTGMWIRPNLEKPEVRERVATIYRKVKGKIWGTRSLSGQPDPAKPDLRSPLPTNGKNVNVPS